MSRPIKFRAWDVFAEEMDYEVTIDPEGKVAAFNPLDGQYVRGFSDDEKVIMQYTGLKDRNGKEIYEGDILAFRNKNMRNDEILGYMKYDESRACWTCTKTLDDEVYGMPYFEECDNGIHENDYVEVIGNIYETPLEDTP